MSAGHESSHGGGHHSGNPAMEWIATHMGGGIDSFGKRFEKLAERLLKPILEGWFMTIARWYVVIASPLLMLQFIVYFFSSNT